MGERDPRELTDEELVALGERWAATDLADIWDQTSPVEFEVSAEVRGNSVVIAPELMERIRAKADELGRNPDDLIQEWLESQLAAG